MKILQVVHGYPPRYNAGSEVYTQTLAHALARQHEVMVFSRLEDQYLPPYTEIDEMDADIPVRLINMPHFRDRYRHERVDAAFDRCLDEFAPDVVHIQHLNHLSTSLVEKAAARTMPVIFTLHDFWLMCPRGQFIQFFSENESETFALCGGQDNSKCASCCYAPRYFSGNPEEHEEDLGYYTKWVDRRMKHVHHISGLVDLFIAPSKQLERRFVNEFGVPQGRIVHLDYGFDSQRLRGRQRQPESDGAFVFGYIGTHLPTKGISQLLDTFAQLPGNARLRIWGRSRAEFTPPLKALHRKLPSGVRERVTWEGEYLNQEIMARVFNQVDAIIVPSIWLENSPLVIHEAQQARVPVITADAGGMAEFVEHEVNGLLYQHRNSSALTAQMTRFVANPSWAAALGQRGYLHTADGNVISTEKHTAAIMNLYEKALYSRQVGKAVLV